MVYLLCASMSELRWCVPTFLSHWQRIYKWHQRLRLTISLQCIQTKLLKLTKYCLPFGTYIWYTHPSTIHCHPLPLRRKVDDVQIVRTSQRHTSPWAWSVETTNVYLVVEGPDSVDGNGIRLLGNCQRVGVVPKNCESAKSARVRDERQSHYIRLLVDAFFKAYVTVSKVPSKTVNGKFTVNMSYEIFAESFANFGFGIHHDGKAHMTHARKYRFHDSNSILFAKFAFCRLAHSIFIPLLAHSTVESNRSLGLIKKTKMNRCAQ